MSRTKLFVSALVVLAVSAVMFLVIDRPPSTDGCLNLAAEGPWPEQHTNIQPSEWPLSADPMLGLVAGMTPIEVCQHLDVFTGTWGRDHSDVEPLFKGMFASFDLLFTGESAWLGTGDLTETQIELFFSAPPSGSQLNKFHVTQNFDVKDEPLLSEVLNEAVRQFGPYSGQAETFVGFPVYAWIIDGGEIWDRESVENECSIARLSQFDLDAMQSVENSCQGLVELVLVPSEESFDRVKRINLIVEDRALLVQSRSIDVDSVRAK